VKLPAAESEELQRLRQAFLRKSSADKEFFSALENAARSGVSDLAIAREIDVTRNGLRRLFERRGIGG
jgi:hypothetical protein